MRSKLPLEWGDFDRPRGYFDTDQSNPNTYSRIPNIWGGWVGVRIIGGECFGILINGVEGEIRAGGLGVLEKIKI